jgi:hypothetical protein
MKEGWWWYWTSGVLTGLVFTIIWASYKFDLTISVEAYLLLIIVFLFSATFFIVGCIVKK